MGLIRVWIWLGFRLIAPCLNLLPLLLLLLGCTAPVNASVGSRLPRSSSSLRSSLAFSPSLFVPAALRLRLTRQAPTPAVLTARNTASRHRLWLISPLYFAWLMAPGHGFHKVRVSGVERRSREMSTGSGNEMENRVTDPPFCLLNFLFPSFWHNYYDLNPNQLQYLVNKF